MRPTQINVKYLSIRVYLLPAEEIILKEDPNSEDETNDFQRIDGQQQAKEKEECT